MCITSLTPLIVPWPIVLPCALAHRAALSFFRFCRLLCCVTLSFSGPPGTLHPDESLPTQIDSPDSSDWRDLFDVSSEIASTAIGAAPMDARVGNGVGQHAVGHGGLGLAEGSTIAKDAIAPGQRFELAEPLAAGTSPLLGDSGVKGREGGCAAATAAVGAAAGAAAPSSGGIVDTDGRFSETSWMEGTAANLREASFH